MSTLQALYVMAFSPEKLENKQLISLTRAAADELAENDKVFAKLMGMLSAKTAINFSNQQHVSTMQTMQVMHTTFSGWMENENVPFEPRLNETFFAKHFTDIQGIEHYILYFFYFK
ncbi:MAG: hypothetical protein HZB19_17145 [Chloroflexi bacterium]|nr:hypothetical protein [Chloroflexota bacterium]